MNEPKAWFAIPGMYGAFSFWLETEHAQAPAQLVTEGWSRVVGGSGQRHIVTPARARLLQSRIWVCPWWRVGEGWTGQRIGRSAEIVSSPPGVQL
jgi:hypothetical protein